ncbi:SIMPL domain-containing protein [Propionicicella superfundia]|uniref:SIMPL domain-containing protein n=1 Tax=Propionicicella superfundia TaxID=348582 RepID=UPI00040870E4|nr:SIMPL domain-containing protein [Propionicicella superfundia]
MHIRVTGEHTLSVPADEAAVRFSLGFSGTDKTAVMNDTVRLCNAAKAELEALRHGGAVASFTIESVRTWASFPDTRARERREQEHHARASASAVFVDFDEVGRVVAEAGARAGWTLAGVTWQLARPTRLAVEPQVLREAFARAQERAGWLADAAGARDLRVAEIADEASVMPHRMAAVYATRAGGAAGDTVPLEFAPEPIEVTGRVSVVFDAEG